MSGTALPILLYFSARPELVEGRLNPFFTVYPPPTLSEGDQDRIELAPAARAPALRTILHRRVRLHASEEQNTHAVSQITWLAPELFDEIRRDPIHGTPRFVLAKGHNAAPESNSWVRARASLLPNYEGIREFRAKW